LQKLELANVVVLLAPQGDRPLTLARDGEWYRGGGMALHGSGAGLKLPYKTIV